ncbi:MAG TPA: lipopolysaccharide kinase InaA family protein [Nakamurella multipartita]|nr:lipopolysaccharide kinase InaA family protein [Nakamurella multipartita]
MSADLVTVRTLDGHGVTFIDTLIGQGGMKDVYMSADRREVVAFYRDPLEPAGHERLRAIVGPYREGIFNRAGGAYWNDLFCWPTGIVEDRGRVGIVVPSYQDHFYCQHGSINGDVLQIKGREKEGKWFASASNRSKFLDPLEKGTWLSHLQVCLRISRAVRRLHAAGLAHSDLSYKNVLVDPTGGRACVIDIDGLVVPGKFAPDVVGTPDFIAPEVVADAHLDRRDPRRKLPSVATDAHALAVLIYMYLLYRHPLRGGMIHDLDPARDEELSMGRNALFVEDPTDGRNRVRADQLRSSELPWGDPSAVPFTITGPLLSGLFRRAFLDGLHDPSRRPSAAEWESELVRTFDLLQPCSNDGCSMGWYVFDNSRKPSCPLCRTAYAGVLPVLNLYSSRGSGSFRPDNHRLMVWDGQSLFPWHVNRFVSPNEHLASAQRSRVGYFRRHAGQWVLVNENLPQMRDVRSGVDIPVGGYVLLTDGGQILLSRADGGRMLQVQLVPGGGRLTA